MNIYGIDFTSTPNRKKPIICAVGELTDNKLHIKHLLKSASLNEFEVFLKRRGPWLAGFDFPFGQPRKLIDNLDWSQNWKDYVANIATMSQQAFETVLTEYRQNRPKGDKQHLRVTDKKAKACSPMMLHGVPVGKMFFKGAPRLLRSGINILPCRPNDDDRIAVETYPALVARKWLDKQSYKNDTSAKQTDQHLLARQTLIAGLLSKECQEIYGFTIAIENNLTDPLIQDPTADSLDAVLCVIQAAWAYTQKYGIPPACDPLEGWIVDPQIVQ